MHTEIEAKLRLARRSGEADFLDAVEDRIERSGATFVREQTETDTYFDDAGGNLKRADKALRLRRIQSTEGEKVLLTFKGPRAKSNFKKRQEAEIEVSDRNRSEQLLAGLGYEKVVTFQKLRRIWRMGDCLICLDHLPMIGDFVEIEGPSARQIANVRRKLALDGLKHIPQSYASLMCKELRRLGRTGGDVML